MFPIWGTSWHNLTSGFPTKRDSNQSPQLQSDKLEYYNFVWSKFRFDIFQHVNNKGANQCPRMRLLVCTWLLLNPQRQLFLRQCHYDLKNDKGAFRHFLMTEALLYLRYKNDYCYPFDTYFHLHLYTQDSKAKCDLFLKLVVRMKSELFMNASYKFKNSKWVWSGNTIITNRRKLHGTARKSHSTIPRHQEDKLNKATSSLFPIKMIAILEWT